jgi:hypothetical protein
MSRYLKELQLKKVCILAKLKVKLSQCSINTAPNHRTYGANMGPVIGIMTAEVEPSPGMVCMLVFRELYPDCSCKTPSKQQARG